MKKLSDIDSITNLVLSLIYFIIIVFIFVYLIWSSVSANVRHYLLILILNIMPFKKKIYRAIDGAGVPFMQTQVEEKESLVKGNKVIIQISTNVDVSAPINHPSFPDPQTFNDLETQLRAGVPLTQVNTCVLHSSDIAELNNEIENIIESDPLNTENNEN